MRISKAVIKEFEHIEREFFDIDEAAREARISLRFDCPSDIFDLNCRSKIPLFNDDFDEWIGTVFEIVPDRYKIALDISFDASEGYSSDELQAIFRKNLLLNTHSHFHAVRERNHIAWGLIVLGLIFFIGMVLVGNLWTEETIWHDVFFYFPDIAATVLLWEAASILLVERREYRTKMRSYRERFSAICFHFETSKGQEKPQHFN